MTKGKTVSESLFEEYLNSQGLTDFIFEKEWSGIPTHPDYTVNRNDSVYIFDVKEFEFRPIPTGLYFGDPYSRIREKINQVRNQFQYFKDKTCCLVLYSLDPLVELYDPIIVQSAMYGDFGLTIPLDTNTGILSDAGTQTFLSGGKMFRIESSQTQNTTISALISLRLIPTGQILARTIDKMRVAGEPIPTDLLDFNVDEKQPAVIVWENIYATHPFPRDLFSGGYDERFGREGNTVTCVFAGKDLLAYEKLFGLET
jgi:hypothetical protein